MIDLVFCETLLSLWDIVVHPLNIQVQCYEWSKMCIPQNKISMSWDSIQLHGLKTTNIKKSLGAHPQLELNHGSTMDAHVGTLDAGWAVWCWCYPLCVIISRFLLASLLHQDSSIEFPSLKDKHICIYFHTAVTKENSEVRMNRIRTDKNPSFMWFCVNMQLTVLLNCSGYFTLFSSLLHLDTGSVSHVSPACTQSMLGDVTRINWHNVLFNYIRKIKNKKNVAFCQDFTNIHAASAPGLDRNTTNTVFFWQEKKKKKS